jgi:hypothetical protein
MAYHRHPFIPDLYSPMQLSPHAEAKCHAEKVWVYHERVVLENDERRCATDYEVLGRVGISSNLRRVDPVCAV